MHDEVSETENIRKNLAIERMIVEGCEVLLDTSQTFVRQGKRSLLDCGFNTDYSDNRKEVENLLKLYCQMFISSMMSVKYLVISTRRLH